MVYIGRELVSQNIKHLYINSHKTQLQIHEAITNITEKRNRKIDV